MKNDYETQWVEEFKGQRSIRIQTKDLIAAYGQDFRGALDAFALREHAGVIQGPAGFWVLSRDI